MMGEGKRWYGIYVFLFFILCVFLLSACGEKESPETYTIDTDTVSSITSVLGEERKLVSSEEVEEEETKKKIYTYSGTEDGLADAALYIIFLTEKQGFLFMSDYSPGSTGGEVTLATSSSEEGKLFEIVIAYAQDGYTITVQKAKGKLPEPVKKKEEAPQDEPSQQGEQKPSEGGQQQSAGSSVNSREQAKELLESLPPEKLGLSAPLASYVVLYDEGRSIVNGVECYGIHAFSQKEDKSTEHIGKYYVACDGSAVFQYDSMQSIYTNIEVPASVQAETQGSTNGGNKKKEEKARKIADPLEITVDDLNGYSRSKKKDELFQELAKGDVVTVQQLNGEKKDKNAKEPVDTKLSESELMKRVAAKDSTVWQRMRRQIVRGDLTTENLGGLPKPVPEEEAE